MEVRHRGTRALTLVLTMIALGFGSSPVRSDQPVAPTAADQAIVQKIQAELDRKFTDPNDPALYERRKRLRDLFSSISSSYAPALYGRLGTRATADELSKSFHGRLATATRVEMLAILRQKAESAPALAAAPPLVWPSYPLPASESKRFDAALQKLKEKVASANDDRKWRYKCWFDLLQRPDVDDRLVRWAPICPRKTGAIGAAFIVGPCDISGMGGPTQDEIQKAFSSIVDVDSKGGDVGIFTHLKSHVVVAEEMTSLPLENLQMLNDDVVSAIDKLDKWANNPTGGSSAMPKAYVSIKDWIGRQQREPRSLYSCK